MLSLHEPSLRLLLAGVCLERGIEPIVLKDFSSLLTDCHSVSNLLAVESARVLAIEGLDDLVRCTRQVIQSTSDTTLTSHLQRCLSSMVEALLPRLYSNLLNVDLMGHHAAFFARLISLARRLLTMQPYVSAIVSPSPVLTPLNDALSEAELPVREMLERETPMGLALAYQLVRALQVGASRTKQTRELPPQTQAMLTGVAYGGGHADAALASVSLLLVLIPSLRLGPKPDAASSVGADRGSRASVARLSSNSFVVLPLLTDLLQVLSEVLDSIDAAEEDASFTSPDYTNQRRGDGSTVDAEYKMGVSWPAHAPADTPPKLHTVSGRQTL